LNLPFEETDLMSCFSCDEGFGGVHADLTAVEPTLTCHYSQDPNLLKVFRDGLGDVYLDLALTLFPEDEELRRVYNPMAPCSSWVKDLLKKARKLAKIIQLAVQYTGTEFAVSNNLRCSLERGEELVDRYWIHYAAVKKCNERLIRLHDQKGFLINAAGRVFRMPWPEHKDTPNRFFQSGGHDILVQWVLGIDRLCQERGIEAVPILADCHDSSSWAAPISQVPALRQVFIDALDEVNDRVNLTIPIKAEVKEFFTLAGLKAEELSLKEAA
jgi:DNA polymerase I-like protein with 3'-5' exonuclease and polymerase domains